MYLTIKAPTKEKFLKFYSIFNREEKNEDQIKFDEFSYKNNLRITFYKNLSIMFNGIIEDDLKRKMKILIDENLYIGIDEVGVGESFGPLIACGFTFNNIIDKHESLFFGIRDSKKLEMNQINAIAKKLETKGKSYCVIIEPNKFNDLWKNKIKNVKAINGIAQNQICLNFSSLNRIVVMDQFVNEKKYYEYLEKYTNNSYKGKILFETKSEDKYLEVAAAAIIAKNKFNDWTLKYLNDKKISFDIGKRINNNMLGNHLKRITNDSEKNNILKEWSK